MPLEAASMTDEARHQAVMAALDTVLDPELDEPLTDLRFIHAVTLDGDEVRVTLRLPTYWCSANFAYIMGEDIKVAVGALPFVRETTIMLVDHFAVRRVNDGLAAGLSFREAFDKEADADLGDV
ncbi:MAG: iron-sulfur cluster assembly protein, partial [Pseudomonadota bacterium]